jgi:hypothetical protein
MLENRRALRQSRPPWAPYRVGRAGA